jgi:hypothetical protein
MIKNTRNSSYNPVLRYRIVPPGLYYAIRLHALHTRNNLISYLVPTILWRHAEILRIILLCDVSNRNGAGIPIAEEGKAHEDRGK